jgi:Holliday junction resolvase-like predicted endonuclease
VHPRLQGDFGELSAAMWLTSQGARVSRPIGHCPDYDLVVDFGDRLIRVEVKTCTSFRQNRWIASICTRGGNQSWSGFVKRWEADRCEFLFVHVADGRRWWIPSNAIDSRNVVMLGGPKFAEYEIEPGLPIPIQT